MKILLDENLSKRIIPLIAQAFPETVALISPATGLTPPISDHSVWQFAKQNDQHIFTRDEDFIKLSLQFGVPPKVVYLAVGNVSNTGLAEIINRHSVDIKDFIADEDTAFLVIGG